MKSFEIYDSKNNITRAGVLEDDKLRVDIKDGDNKIIVKDNNINIYESTVSVNYAQDDSNHLVYVLLEDGTPAIINNKFRDGFNTINWIRIQDKNNKIENAIMKSNIFNIKNLIPGDYIFWCKNKDKKTNELNITMLDKSKDVIIEKIKGSIYKFNSIHESVLCNISESKKSIIESIVNEINSSDEYNEEAVADISMAYEMLWNNEILIANNFDYILNDYIRTPRTIDNLDADTLIVYEYINGKKKPHSKITGKHELYLKPGKYYTIEAFKNNSLVGSILSIGMKESMIVNNWKTEKESSILFDELIQRKKTFEFNNESSTMAAIKQMKNIQKRLINNPSITIDNGKMNVFIEDYSFLKALGGDFYISICEIGNIFKPKKITKRKIIGRNINYSIVDLGLISDKEYVCFISDSNERQISSDSYLSLDEFDVNELRISELSQEVDKILIAINDIDKKDYNAVKDLLEYLSGIEDINIHNLYKSFIPQIKQIVTNFGRIADVVLKNMFDSVDVNEAFFSAPVTYEEDNKILIAPILENKYVAIIERFNIGDSILDTKHYSIENNNQNKIYTGNYDYCIVSFINDDLVSSGYAIFSRLKYEKVFLKYKMLMEVK